MAKKKKRRRRVLDPGNEPPPAADTGAGWSGTKTLIVGGIVLLLPLTVLAILSQTAIGRFICLVVALVGLKLLARWCRSYAED